jgi:DNA-directed RNA polymerase subunit RPC12/RpoP
MREGRFYAYRFSKDGELNGELVESDVLVKKTFYCADCGSEISTTGEDREKRATITCPKCKVKYKLHPSYANHGGEIVQYEEQTRKRRENIGSRQKMAVE